MVVLEAGDAPGGGSRTAETIPGYRFDLHSVAHNLINMTDIPAELDLAGAGLAYVEMNPFATSIGVDGRHVRFWRSVDATVASIAEHDRAEADAYRAFIEIAIPVVRALLPSVRADNSVAGRARAGWHLAQGVRRDGRGLVRDLLGSYGAMLRRRLPTELTRGYLDRLSTLEDGWAAAEAGRLPSTLPMYAFTPSALDTTLAPPGHHTVYLACLTAPAQITGGWEAHRDALVDAALDTVEAHAPGFRSTVVDTYAWTPDRMDADGRWPGAHPIHLDLGLDQVGPFRPAMTEPRGETWQGWRQAFGVVARPVHLRRTTATAVIVGTVLFANQLNVVVAGHATTVVWLKTGLNYLVPFVVSNVGILIATRR